MIYDGNLTSLASGYTQVALNHLCSLVEAGHDDITFFPTHGPIPWNTWPDWTDPVRRARGRTRDLVFVHATVDKLASVLRREDARYVGMTAIDTDRVARWVSVGINKALDALIVPSDHCVEAARKGGITIPIHKVPHTLGVHAWNTPTPDRPHDDRYRFYYIGSWNARKNPEGALRAYCRSFRPDDGACLSLKLTGTDALRFEVEEIVRDEERAAGRTVTEDFTRPDVVVSAGYLSDSAVRMWHGWGDCFVSTHRGEAWGQAAFEAACMGKPIIATAWSGMLEFLSEERGDVLVPPTSLVPVTGMSGLIQFGRDQLWAEPDLEATGAAMATVFCERRTTAMSGGLREKYGWATMGPVLADALRL